MSKKHWPRIRIRRYEWQDKNGTHRESTSYQINVRFPNGTRTQHTFKNREEAESEAQRLRDERTVELLNRNVSLKQLTDEQRIDVLEAIRILKGKTSLRQAAEFNNEHNILPSGTILTVDSATERYLIQSQEDGLRERSVGDLRVRLNIFSKTFGKKAVTSISRSDADEWLRELKKASGKAYSPISRNHFRVVASGLFNWMIEKGYTTTNPFMSLTPSRRGKKILRDITMPEILKPDRVMNLMNTAQAHVQSMVAPLAVSFFAGLRTSEIQLLKWEDINFTNRLITIRPEVAKRRRARHIEMESNLIEWLMSCRRESGLIAPAGQLYRIRFDEVRRKAGFKKDYSDYPKNAGRHSYGTFALQKYQSAPKVALMLGHTTTGLLFDHYKSLATPEESEQYWAIRPTKTGNVIQLKAN